MNYKQLLIITLLGLNISSCTTTNITTQTAGQRNTKTEIITTKAGNKSINEIKTIHRINLTPKEKKIEANKKESYQILDSLLQEQYIEADFKKHLLKLKEIPYDSLEKLEKQTNKIFFQTKNFSNIQKQTTYNYICAKEIYISLKPREQKKFKDRLNYLFENYQKVQKASKTISTKDFTEQNKKIFNNWLQTFSKEGRDIIIPTPQQAYAELYTIMMQGRIYALEIQKKISKDQTREEKNIQRHNIKELLEGGAIPYKIHSSYSNIIIGIE